MSNCSANQFSSVFISGPLWVWWTRNRSSGGRRCSRQSASFTFMRGLCEQLMVRLTSEVLRFAPQSPFAQFTHITMHDGTSFAVKSTLKKTFPGRFTKISPAAVERHVTMEL